MFTVMLLLKGVLDHKIEFLLSPCSVISP